MRYSDWALGEFFKKIRNKPWYKDSLFVILGDHGFSTPKQITDMDLLRFRVTLLFLAPGIQEGWGSVNDITSSQVDVVPTAVAMLGRPFQHACWGKNLLDESSRKSAYAVIKPSGSDKTVGIISGDRILVKAPDRAPLLYRYDVDEKPYSTQLKDSPIANDLYQKLGSYIQTALRALAEHRAGQEGTADLLSSQSVQGAKKPSQPSTL
jgi:phosphoglycerol transferase MdoB-like AlkP superfamily enzyme